jgi:hypothetical protein
MISELNQPARIASLECGLVKIPCLPEVFVSNVGAARMNFIAHLPGGRPARYILFPFFFRFSCGHARSKESAGAFCRLAGADLGH